MTNPLAERELLLWRHGIAEERHPDRPDAERALTAEGSRRTAAVAQELKRLQLCCDPLLSSPLRRAAQTAELGVAAGLASGFAIEASLAPGGDPRPLLQAGNWQGRPEASAATRAGLPPAAKALPRNKPSICSAETFASAITAVTAIAASSWNVA